MAKKEIDRLTRRAIEAESLGMSYGNYMAKFHPPQIPAVRHPKKHVDGEKQCLWCGVWFISNHQSRKYCGMVCAANAREHQKRAAAERKRAAQGA